jgi:xylulokinase
MAPENPYILAADVGTSSLKTVIYSRQGHLIGTATQRYTYQSSYPGWAEGNAEDWWQSFKVTLADLRQQGVNLAEVEAIAFTGQMHTAVLLDAHGQVLEPTI